MKQIITHLKNSRHVLLATHAKPDGDALGSILAMGLALEACGKTVTFYNESPIPAAYGFLPAVGRIQAGFSDPYDTAVLLDCSTLDRVGKAAAAMSQIPALINIDHHASNDGFGTLNLVDPAACATAEIVYGVIKALGVSLDRDMATCIYTGILTDTGSFQFSNTSRTTFDICEELVGLGVRPDVIARHIYGTFPLRRLRLLALVLGAIELAPGGEFALMTVTEAMMAESGTTPADTDGMVNYARGIETVKLAALIQAAEKKNGEASGFHVSLRSNGGVDASAVAGLFGGGGHVPAAGFYTELPLEEIKSRLFDIAGDLVPWEVPPLPEQAPGNQV